MNSGRAAIEDKGGRSRPALTRHAAILWALTLLFALRVMGQAVQHWWPQPFLPPFNAFQGSGLGYPLLLTTQITILTLMIWSCRRVNAGAPHPNKRGAQFLTWFGGIYLAGSIFRIIVGLSLPDAPFWFRAWIPAFFHLVLAGFVLVLVLYARERLSAASAN